MWSAFPKSVYDIVFCEHCENKDCPRPPHGTFGYPRITRFTSYVLRKFREKQRGVKEYGYKGSIFRQPSWFRKLMEDCEETMRGINGN